MKNKNRISPIYALWLLVMVTLAIFVGLSFSDDLNIGDYTLKKGTFHETLMSKKYSDEISQEEFQDIIINPVIREVVEGPDSTIRNVLIFGDSMTHYLAMSISKYGSKNNYKVTSVTWVSSSITKWSKTDKIKKYMDEVNPDFIIISLGANDVGLRDFEAKIPEIKKITDQLGDVPFIWVGPAMWKADKGLYPMLEKALGQAKVFRLDETIKIPRAGDHIHPTKKGADVWADTLMRWIKTSPHPILADYPDSQEVSKEHKFIYLHAQE